MVTKKNPNKKKQNNVFLIKKYVLIYYKLCLKTIPVYLRFEYTAI